MPTSIPLSEIGYDVKYYPRVNGKPDWLTVHRYREVYRHAKQRTRYTYPFDEPITVVRATAKPYKYLLLDGLHRVVSGTAEEIETIPANVEHLPESKWRWRAAELNVKHGRNLDTGDKAFVAAGLKADGFSIPEIAGLFKMPAASLEKIIETRMTKVKAKAVKDLPTGRSHREIDGQHVGFLKAAFADTVGTATAQEALRLQGAVCCHDALNALRNCIAVLEIGVDMTDEEIQIAVERLKEILK